MSKRKTIQENYVINENRKTSSDMQKTDDVIFDVPDDQYKYDVSNVKNS